jgi:tetratricopeptide (TPR) repeat protein
LVSPYAYSEAGFPRLALLHYNKLVSLQHQNDMAWNNYGVVLDELGLPGQSADAYRIASDKSNTLAMSNISNRLLAGGFFDEADRLLEKARSLEEVHPNIGLSMSALDDARKSETDRLDGVLKSARSAQQFIREFSATHLAGEETPHGASKFVTTGLDLVVSQQSIFGTWLKEASQCFIAQAFPVRAAELRLSKRLASRQQSSFEPAGSLLALVDESLSRLRVMWPDGTLQDVEASAET